jgi:cytidylate kinase
MVGRDIGTVVLPEADRKIYLDAVVDDRARRRHAEVVQRRAGAQPEEGSQRDADYTAILEAMVRRDRIDSSRQVAPLRPADDAVVVDTTDMTVEQVLDRVLELVQDRC